MDTAFNCTQCGKCCHNLHIPLSVREAHEWLSRGHKIKILTEAIPWVKGYSSTDEVLMRKESMTFEGVSGELSIRVMVTLVGYFSDGCPNLDLNQNCTIYESRPLTCRIYPFEMNPKIILDPNNKLCPSEAWQLVKSNQKPSNQLFLIDLQTKNNINKIYADSIQDVRLKELLCISLEIKACSLSNNGYLFHHVDQLKLLEIINKITSNPNSSIKDTEKSIDWMIYSLSTKTLEDLNALGSHASYPEPELVDKMLKKTREFISLIP